LNLNVKQIESFSQISNSDVLFGKGCSAKDEEMFELVERIKDEKYKTS